ncbi:MucR family transcriptional regulator [Komagataeibacter rhaeticus]|nr:MucR family transcriptional regulator [Komagataeibacter rhaeticus]
MTPTQYREKWQLPMDYPMVAPEYAKMRAALARDAGLGRKILVPRPLPWARQLQPLLLIMRRKKYRSILPRP